MNRYDVNEVVKKAINIAYKKSSEMSKIIFEHLDKNRINFDKMFKNYPYS